jgi:hypothetical protein
MAMLFGIAISQQRQTKEINDVVSERCASQICNMNVKKQFCGENPVMIHTKSDDVDRNPHFVLL